MVLVSERHAAIPRRTRGSSGIRVRRKVELQLFLHPPGPLPCYFRGVLRDRPGKPTVQLKTHFFCSYITFSSFHNSHPDEAANGRAPTAGTRYAAISWVVQRSDPASLPPLVPGGSHAGSTCHDKSGRPRKFQGDDSTGRNVARHRRIRPDGNRGQAARCHRKGCRVSTSHDAEMVLGAYLAMNLIGQYMIVPLGRAVLRNELVQQVPANVSGTQRGPRDFSLLRDCLIPDLLAAMVRCPGTKDR